MHAPALLPCAAAARRRLAGALSPAWRPPFPCSY